METAPKETHSVSRKSWRRRARRPAPSKVLPRRRARLSAPSKVLPRRRARRSAPSKVLPRRRARGSAPSKVLPRRRGRLSAPSKVLPRRRGRLSAPSKVCPSRARRTVRRGWRNRSVASGTEVPRGEDRLDEASGRALHHGDDERLAVGEMNVERAACVARSGADGVEAGPVEPLLREQLGACLEESLPRLVLALVADRSRRLSSSTRIALGARGLGEQRASSWAHRANVRIRR